MMQIFLFFAFAFVMGGIGGALVWAVSMAIVAARASR